MNFKKLAASTLTAMLLAGAAQADDKNLGEHVHVDQDNHATQARYDFNLIPGEVMIFPEPVSFTGEVVATDSSHRTLKTRNDMLVRIPNQAMVWNGDTQKFAQSTNLGDNVVVHMRAEEPYRIMHKSLDTLPTVAIGSYEGVFFVPAAFIDSLDLDNLDNNIYNDKDTADIYDEDLEMIEE